MFSGKVAERTIDVALRYYHQIIYRGRVGRVGRAGRVASERRLAPCLCFTTRVGDQKKFLSDHCLAAEKTDLDNALFLRSSEVCNLC